LSWQIDRDNYASRVQGLENEAEDLRNQFNMLQGEEVQAARSSRGRK